MVNPLRTSDVSNEQIYFSEHETKGNQYYCVCFVDMVGSTQIIARIQPADRIGKYYSIFLNAISALAKNFQARVIKNVGDALIFYFPNTSDLIMSLPSKKCLNALVLLSQPEI